MFLPLLGWAQSLNGVYTGVLFNDSTTIRKDQSFEMALTEYKGKVYGYVYSTFIVNDTLYYIVKRVKGTVTGDVCEVKDDDIISHNFPKKPEKGVFVTYTLRRSENDTTWKLDGGWKTNTTKKYYALTGKVDTREEKDLSKSKLYEHLGDLNLQQTLALNKPTAENPEKKNAKTKTTEKDLAKNTVKTGNEKNAAITAPTNKKSESAITSGVTKVPESKSTSIASNNPTEKTEKNKESIVNTTPVNNTVQESMAKNENKSPVAKPVVNNPQTDIVKTDIKAADTKNNNITTGNQTLPVGNTDVNTNGTKSGVYNTQAEIVKAVTKNPDIKTNSVNTSNQPEIKEIKNTTVADTRTTGNITQTADATANTKTTETNTNGLAINNQSKPTDINANTNSQSPTENKQEYVFTELSRSNRKLKPAVTMVKNRESVPSETIFFKSDSLVLALYDNGEVDGDTVSVIINDEVFVEKQGLKSAAFKKTFYFYPELGDSLLVVLFAENLGKYPPNTGLLIIKDGDDQHYVRFKADLDRNAAILLRKKYQ